MTQMSTSLEMNQRMMQELAEEHAANANVIESLNLLLNH